MKKAYIICLILFIAVTVYSGTYLYARVRFGNEFDVENRFVVSEEEEYTQPETVYEAAANNQLICNLTTFVLEKYYVETGILTEEKINTPVELLGMSRDKLIIYMKKYIKNPDEEDVKNGIIAFELISFSRDRVVFRKTYSNDALTTKFYGRIENGYMTIYLEDGKTLYDYTNINVERLPADIQKELETGKEFGSTAELYDFLETFSS